MPPGWGSRLKPSRPASASRTAGWLAMMSAVRGVAPTVASTPPVLLVTSSRFDLSWCWYPSATSCTVGGSLVSTAALSGGASAMNRAICVNVSVRVVRRLSTRAAVATISRSSVRSASCVTRTFTREMATPMQSTASAALARKMRLRSDDSSVIAA